MTGRALQDAPSSADIRSVMQLADWLFTLLLLRSDDPHGRSAVDVALPPRTAPVPASNVLPPQRPLRRSSQETHLNR